MPRCLSRNTGVGGGCSLLGPRGGAWERGPRPLACKEQGGKRGAPRLPPAPPEPRARGRLARVGSGRAPPGHHGHPMLTQPRPGARPPSGTTEGDFCGSGWPQGAQPQEPSAGRGLPGEAEAGRPHAAGPRSQGAQGNREASNSVYFEVTFFKKNSFPQMLDPASGMWRGKQLSTARPAGPTRGGSGGALGDVAVRGRSVEPGSGLRSQPRCVPGRALTAPRPGQAQLILALVHRPGPSGLRHRLSAARATPGPAPHFCSCWAPRLCAPRPAACPSSTPFPGPCLQEALRGSLEASAPCLARPQ